MGGSGIFMFGKEPISLDTGRSKSENPRRGESALLDGSVQGMFDLRSESAFLDDSEAAFRKD